MAKTTLSRKNAAMDDELFLPWPEVARAISHYVWAQAHWPDGAEFELINGENGLLVRLMKPDGDPPQDAS